MSKADHLTRLTVILNSLALTCSNVHCQIHVCFKHQCQSTKEAL